MTRFVLIVIAVLLGVSDAGSALEPVNPNLSPEGREVLNYLESTYGKSVLAGYNVYVHTPDDYGQTGKQAAIWGRDIRYLGNAEPIITEAKANAYIVTLHWHWFFNEDSAWTAKRKSPVDVGKMVTPGTPEHAQTLKELDITAERLQQFEDAGIPVLWRPLHEIDGGWFWWTDKDNPENTAKLWRMMFDYFTHTKKLDNLIWVYSAGVGKKTLEYRKGFYPGAEYVDISGIDVYGVDYKTADPKYWEYYNMMAAVSPGKMLACGECDAIPNPGLMRDGSLPKWLYAMPWWGAPSAQRPVTWARMTMSHPFVITLDELPSLTKDDIAPHVGLMQPVDDGSAWSDGRELTLEAYATDPSGQVARVKFLANGSVIGTDDSAPYSLVWSGMAPGCYELTAVAIDDTGHNHGSNRVRATLGMRDAARGRPVTTSSGKNAEAAVDGDYYTPWQAENAGEAWLYVDLGTSQPVNQVNLMWGWKIHASEFAIDVATTKPEAAASWREVHHTRDRAYETWEAVDRITFPAVDARYVRLRALKRAGNQTWAGYNLMALEVPVPSD